jgi:MoaA/NifB/PqqE/SkfB family radical SAM enzyme
MPLIPYPKEVCLIITYRCNAKCNMCDVWQLKTSPKDEITIADIEKIPSGLRFINITGGEPFVRQDMKEIVAAARKKAGRIVISTNGYFTDRIIDLCKTYPDIGIRISIEGLQKTNDDIRGIPHGFDRGIRTLLTLRRMGLKDIGFGMTLQEMNCQDLIPLYDLANALGYEFATATLHNSHYFNKSDNKIGDKDKVCAEFEKLIAELLKSNSPKKWFRAYLNYGLMNFIKGNKRFLKCETGTESCFIDPSGDVLACNGMSEKMSMGNIRTQSFNEIWNSPEAARVRQTVGTCTKECWMTGSAVPVMKKHIEVPLKWVSINKCRSLLGLSPILCLMHSKKG